MHLFLLGVAGLVGSGAMPAAEQPCELDLWPAAHFGTLTEGFILNNTVDSGFHNPGEHPVPRTVPLDPAGQLRLLEGMDPARALGLPVAALIVHAEPAPPSTDPAARRTANLSSCYVELSVAKIFYSRSPFAGRSLRVLFSLRDFRGTGAVRRFSTWADAPLRLFPPEPGADPAPALAELQDAFRQAFRRFATLATATVSAK